MPAIDLNCDLGESYGTWTIGDDSAMLGVVTSANIACGFHAGDPRTLLDTCTAAAAGGVTIGAQVSYPDLAGVGRRFIDIAPPDLEADVLSQLGALDGLARASGSRIRYVKPHGALYNAVVHHEEQARAVIAAVARYDPGLIVLCLPGSALHEHARSVGLRTVSEAFADRAYHDDGTLVSRREEGSVLHDPGAIADRALQLVHEGTITSINGKAVAISAESLCVHGDTPGAVGIARAVREALSGQGIDVRPFC
ncbi:LamB/YcsF family protein [Hoyosella sp. G463]|uniref:5-oxoprolinase subunit A n=1 Tax=Lolliginicoccus lacisalsi TaxID=2742202 RepID=A0A927PLK7_9ACTN|nr:5-oxoprolinase subunit PxpA [Lolliginicoccus lacisalsi]MBD8505924.1 LamB/YcsF family protein [Lolliginicoccus lacisalsi]